MRSIRDIYKIGVGPSSSHTMGPQRASRLFLEENPQAEEFEVVLYGSLSKTGVGHGTDRVIRQTFAPKPCRITFSDRTPEGVHPNTLDLIALAGGKEIARLRVESVGGGDIRIHGRDTDAQDNGVYRETTFAQILDYCKYHYITKLSDYVLEQEGEEILPFLMQVWQTMKQAVADGLQAEGVLPGGLKVQRRAKTLYESVPPREAPQMEETRTISAYAFAVAEQNADNGTIVTAPTCGACGVLPACMLYIQQTQALSDAQMLRGLATAGLIGNLVKTNASISGAECGCQAEIGTACAMAAAALSELYGHNMEQVEYAAEIAMEHHLGLTCDPICGLVQIPCIERNAVAALRAMNASNLSFFLYGSRNISFDMVVRTMYETGRDLGHPYRETGEGGLARLYVPKE